MSSSSPMQGSLSVSLPPSTTLDIDLEHNPTTYRIKKFDRQRVASTANGPNYTSAVSVIIGKRARGKTTLVRDLLWQNRDIPVGIVMSATEPCTHEYSKIMPKICIHDEYKPEIIENVLKRQLEICRRKNESHSNISTIIDPRAFVVLDDCMYAASQFQDRHNKNFRPLFLNSRHLKTNIFITMGYSYGFSPALRCNIDYIFLFGTESIGERKRLYDHYGSMFPTFEAFCQVFEKCTDEPYNCMVIDQTAHAEKGVENMVFWYHADIHDDADLKLCAPDFWNPEALTAMVRALPAMETLIKTWL